MLGERLDGFESKRKKNSVVDQPELI
jgi:hypothetical protein